MYVKGYTNPTNILADFVGELCFGEEHPEHKWRLEYPRFDYTAYVDDAHPVYEVFEDTTRLYSDELPEGLEIADVIAKYKELIVHDRRATISTSYTPASRWIEETYIMRPVDIEEINGRKILNIHLKSDIIANSPVDLYTYKNKVHLYQTESPNMDILEYYVDYENSVIKFDCGGFSNDTVFIVKYKTQNLKSYTWYVSLMYPKVCFDYKPMKAAIKIELTPYTPNNEVLKIIITNDEGHIVAIQKNDVEGFNISPAYRDVIQYTGNVLTLGVTSKNLYIQPVTFSINTTTLAALEVKMINTVSGYEEKQTKLEHKQFHLIDREEYASLNIADSFEAQQEINLGIINGGLKYFYNKVNIQNVSLSEFTEELDKLIERRNQQHLNESYFCWQFGNEIDDNYHIKIHKNYDSPVFTCFFHNLDKLYNLDWIEQNNNAITYFLSWDERSCAFAFCEDPQQNTVHGFGYFGALNSLTKDCIDDYAGNFGSIGNNVIDNPYKEALLPNSIADLTPFDNVHRNVMVKLRAYYGPYCLGCVDTPVLTMLDSEFDVSTDNLFNIYIDTGVGQIAAFENEAFDIYKLPFTFGMVCPEDMKPITEYYYDTVPDELVSFERDAEWYYYYINYIDDSYVEPTLTTLQIEPKYVIIYRRDILQRNLYLPKYDPDVVQEQNFIVDTNFTIEDESIVEVTLEKLVDEGILSVKSLDVLESTVVHLETTIRPIKYLSYDIAFPVQTADVDIIVWDFSTEDSVEIGEVVRG